jgi:LysR family transcriptional regulator, cys regulon transcriptional activator
MTLQQLRYLCEIANCNLSISAAALALHTSQPGMSKQILALEDELGVQIFVRRGKRLSAITPAGQQLINIAQQTVMSAKNIKRAALDLQDNQTGEMVIATTHTQARYVLPRIIPTFLKRFPEVSLFIHQGNPAQVAAEVASGRADIGIATEQLDAVPDLATLPLYNWNRVLVTPKSHPILQKKKLQLADIAAYPLVSYDVSFTGRSAVNNAFAEAGLTPTFVLSAMDSDVIKTYVELGIGIGLLAEMAYEPERDTALACTPVAHLFPESTTKVAIKRASFVRSYTYAFLALLQPKLTQSVINDAVLQLRN